MKSTIRHAPGIGRAAFSLIEILVSIGVVATLSVLLFSGIQGFKERAGGTRCMANLRQIGAATAMYGAEHNNALPYYPYRVAGGGVGSGAIPGAWFYNLAPYLSIPRAEVSTPAGSTDRTLLGTSAAPIPAPCVFTCPDHRRDESNLFWKPQPMTFPTRLPVSYAPATMLDSAFVQRYQKDLGLPATDPVDPLALSVGAIVAPSKKIWLCDSPTAYSLNVSSTRWQTRENYADNFPRQGFTRHNNGGNALFFDGHVEHLPLKTFTESPDGIEIELVRYFHPFVEK